MGAIHAAFVSGSYENWAATCDALVSQKRLSAADAVQCRQILQFGRLIGNTDMHSGNASLYASGTTLKVVLKGRFQLTPVYDMLPMRWPIAVETPITERPPHRSQRAQFAHWAPTLGLINIGGRLVLSLDYTYVGPVQQLLGTLSQTTCAPLPEGRTQPWQWTEVLTTGQLPVDAHGRKVCDVMEVWSSQRVNPPGIKAVHGSLTWGYFTACHDSTVSGTGRVGAEVGLMHCTQTQPGPLR
jgi:hypothetical protein